MNMQDNELDDLFRSKLGGLEIEPAARVWGNISTGLGGEKKRSWAPVWSVAAAILVVLGIGTWFVLDRPDKASQNQVAQHKPALKKVEVIKPIEPQAVEHALAKTMVTQPVKQGSRFTGIKHAGHRPAEVTKDADKAKIEEDKPVSEQPVQLLAATPDKPVMHPVVPEMQLSIETIDADAATVKPVAPAAPVMAAVHQPEKKKRQGIHSLGGLINVVIAKVDKREDKLIEFTESDDDQANITGINLGLIKLKKDK